MKEHKERFLRRGEDAGEVVHYVLKDGPRVGECRPALLIRPQDPENGIMVFHIFTDGFSDDPRFTGASVRAVVTYSAEAEPGTWHLRAECRTGRGSRIEKVR